MQKQPNMVICCFFWKTCIMSASKRSLNIGWNVLWSKKTDGKFATNWIIGSCSGYLTWHSPNKTLHIQYNVCIIMYIYIYDFCCDHLYTSTSLARFASLHLTLKLRYCRGWDIVEVLLHDYFDKYFKQNMSTKFVPIITVTAAASMRMIFFARLL